MIPAEEFPQANTVFNSPPDLEGSCLPIKAHIGQVQGGIFDGSMQCIVAWKPTVEELAELNRGGSIYLAVMGGLPPHCLSTNFEAIKQTS